MTKLHDPSRDPEYGNILDSINEREKCLKNYSLRINQLFQNALSRVQSFESRLREMRASNSEQLKLVLKDLDSLSRGGEDDLTSCLDVFFQDLSVSSRGRDDQAPTNRQDRIKLRSIRHKIVSMLENPDKQEDQELVTATISSFIDELSELKELERFAASLLKRVNRLRDSLLLA